GGQPFLMPGSVADYRAPAEEDPDTGESTPAGYEVLLEDAMTAARNAGYVGSYEFVIVAFPDIGFPWAGLGAVGGGVSWVQDLFEPGVVAHELGHNFGLWHANYWQPVGVHSRGAYPVDNARAIEYGNIFDAMGGARNFPSNHFSGNSKYI